MSEAHVGGSPPEIAIPLISDGVSGPPQKGLALRLGLSLSGSKSRAQKGREKLKKLLLACGHFELDRAGNVLIYEKNEDCQYCNKC